MARYCDLCNRKLALLEKCSVVIDGMSCSVCEDCYIEYNELSHTDDVESVKEYFDSVIAKNPRFDMSIKPRLDKVFEDLKAAAQIREQQRAAKKGTKYSVKGVRGKSLDVFEDKCVITVGVTIGSILTSNATDGEKIIYYKDIIGIQYKEPGFTVGYLQLETSAPSMNNGISNFFGENSFTFDNSGDSVGVLEMQPIVEYIKKRVEDYKRNDSGTVQAVSAADEIKKFKELLDMGVITQEEFDAKKKQLLGL